ncbi:MAG: histidine phosphatase family protein [Candidatus Paceibacterota bacterium]|jgi:probable phosphoglycerate mutase
MKIFVVRHGETDSNKAHKLMGQLVDESLNIEGVRQIQELIKNININDFDVIFTSPLKRARETAEIIAAKIKIPIIEKKEISERDFGSMSGKSWEEMDSAIKEVNVNFKMTDLEQKYNYRPYGGESVEDVKERVLRFIEELKSQYSDKKVLIIAHGGIMKIMNLLLLRNIINTPGNSTVRQFDI